MIYPKLLVITMGECGHLLDLKATNIYTVAMYAIICLAWMLSIYHINLNRLNTRTPQTSAEPEPGHITLSFASDFQRNTGNPLNNISAGDIKPQDMHLASLPDVVSILFNLLIFTTS
jgi:hypothetical protein